MSFVYLRLGATKMTGFIEAVTAQFGQRRWVIVDPSLTVGEARALSTRFSAQVIAVNAALNWAKPQITAFDSVVCHGGHGTVAQTLSQGLRLLMLPQHTEQWLLARRAMLSQPTGTGIAMAHPSAALPALMQALVQLFTLSAPVPPTDAAQSTNPTQALVQRIVTAAHRHAASSPLNNPNHVHPA
jgi:UDP:flavonoid glycosyltransferase YjiC (YdhE family)